MTEDPFVAHRSLLFTVAYEMLGSAADAEDVLQESWLRWADVDRAQVRNPRAYLIQIVTRQALNHLRTLSRKREDYIGEWRLRARERVAARRPRTRVSRAEQRAVVERFLAALRTGRLQELMEVMAPDVVLIADGGGLAGATLAPVHGAELVAKVLARASRSSFSSAIVWLNGAPGGRIEAAGEAGAVSIVVEDGRVARVYLFRNPLKLTRLDEPADLAR
jgi:RNA polymerase sigma factor (sigma-70 family)